MIIRIYYGMILLRLRVYRLSEINKKIYNPGEVAKVEKYDKIKDNIDNLTLREIKDIIK